VINNRVEASKNKDMGRKCVISNLDEIPEGMRCTEEEFEERMVVLYREVNDAIPNSPSDSENERSTNESNRKRYPQFNHNVNAKDIKFKVGDRFESKEKFKQTVIDYAVANRFGVTFTRSEAKKIQGKCKGCTWYIWALKMSTQKSWQITSYVWQHTCKKVLLTSILQHVSGLL